MNLFLQGAQGREKARKLAAQELAVTEAALLENPKSYTAWHHRLWIMRKGLAPASEELKLISRFEFPSPYPKATPPRVHLQNQRSSAIESSIKISGRLEVQGVWPWYIGLLKHKLMSEEMILLSLHSQS